MEAKGLQKIESAVVGSEAEDFCSLLRRAISHTSISSIPPPPIKKLSCLNCLHLPAAPSGVWESDIQSLCSCDRRRGADTRSFHSYSDEIEIGTGSPLSSCTRSSRGDYPCPHDTPSSATGDIKRVLQVPGEGLPWGAIQLPHAKICVHVCRDYLGVELACPSCNKTFFNPDVLRHLGRAMFPNEFPFPVTYYTFCSC